MASVADQRYLLGGLAAVAAAPLWYFAGAGSIHLWRAVTGPLSSAEGQIADAYSAFFIGGPLGLVLGTAFTFWLLQRLAQHLTCRVAGIVLLGIAACGAWALHYMTTH